MNAIEGLEVLLVGLCTVLVAAGLAASALNVLFTCFLERERRTLAE
jgi:hypothetical protein